MSRTDLISDAFTIIRNGVMVKKENVDVPASNMLGSILKILKKENYIDNFKLIEDKKQGILRIYLRYISGRPAIKNIRRISRPGLRVYARYDKLPIVIRGRGIAIISTSKGIMTNKQAKESQVGGEVIGYVW